ncbi:hypothetical protein TIFTF001_018361 [Ficus carica]|uniref:Uncharacterized protein n=1 Tax=Ficus carica TaxID=3494 RepID=A0AA88ACA7_FICCA|nr:hypothetical protein TIFTF001_018361 [Ficus carica]
MRLQWPRFSLKPEPDRAPDHARPGLNLVRSSVLTGFNSTSDTTNPNKVNNLSVTVDARWRCMAWRTVKCGNLAATRIEIVNIVRDSVLTGSSSTSDTANANKVSNLLATADARWWSVAGQAVKCGKYAATRFVIILCV